MRKTLFYIITACLLTLLAACGPSAAPGPGGPQPTGGTVTLTLQTPTETWADAVSVSFSPGASAFDVLLDYAKTASIPVDYSGSGTLAYIQGINNLYEFDDGPESGWLYSVNDAYPATGCGAYAINDGDKLVFLYVTEKTAWEGQ